MAEPVLTFISVVSCCVINIVQFKVVSSNAFLSNVLATLGNPALLTILGNRMLFNLQEAAELGVNQGTNVRVPSRTMSNMDFAGPEDPQRCDFLFPVEAITDHIPQGKHTRIC